MSEKKIGRPRIHEKPRKARQVYADEDQIEYLRWWLKFKGNVPKKPWKL